MRLYIYMGVLKILLFYYFIDLCHFLHRFKLRPTKFINLWRLLIYRVLIYRGSTVNKKKCITFSLKCYFEKYLLVFLNQVK